MRVVEAQGVVLEPQLAAHADEMFALLADPAIRAYAFKRANHRSRHLLECLGFAPAPPGMADRLGLEPDERLMQREVAPA